jgi:uncharacterized membrane protein
MNFLKKYFGLFVILILSFWAIKPFFASGFFPIHDDTQVARVFEMNKVLQEGIFPVRVVPDLGYGYGYPIFNFYAPLAYYIGAGFMFLGFNALIATKLMMALGIVLAGIFMYFLVREFFGEFGGIVSGLFYLYAPYHAVNIYVRGDVAEFWAYAFIPLAFLGFYKRNILLGVIGFAGIIISHNLTAMMIAPFILIPIILNSLFAPEGKKLNILLQSLLMVLLGLAISAFYWIPALTEMKSTNVLSTVGGGANFRSNFVCLNQLWNSPWGFGGSVPGCIDGLSFKIGKLHVLISLVAFIMMLCFERFRKSKVGLVVLVSFLGLLLSVFLMLEVSRPIWEAISLMSFFQYPWRFLILTSFFSSILAGSIIYILKQFNIKAYLVSIFLVFILLFFNIKLFVPQAVLLATVEDYTSETTLKWTVSKISDEYLPRNFKKPSNQNEVYKGQSNIRVKSTLIENISNIVSLVGLLVLAIGIIKPKLRQKYE